MCTGGHSTATPVDSRSKHRSPRAVDGAIAVAADVLTPLFDVAAVEVGRRRPASTPISAAHPRSTAPSGWSSSRRAVEIECRVTAEGGTAGPVDPALTIVILDADANWEIDLFG